MREGCYGQWREPFTGANGIDSGLPGMSRHEDFRIAVFRVLNAPSGNQDKPQSPPDCPFAGDASDLHLFIFRGLGA